MAVVVCGYDKNLCQSGIDATRSHFLQPSLTIWIALSTNLGGKGLRSSLFRFRNILNSWLYCCQCPATQIQRSNWGWWLHVLTFCTQLNWLLNVGLDPRPPYNVIHFGEWLYPGALHVTFQATLVLVFCCWVPGHIATKCKFGKDTVCRQCMWEARSSVEAKRRAKKCRPWPVCWVQRDLDRILHCFIYMWGCMILS